MVHIAANGTRVCLNRYRREPEPCEDAQVRAVEALVGGPHPLAVPIEGVAIGHDELPRPHEPEARSWLVPKLRLHLVHHRGQVTVAAQIRTKALDHDLLVGWPEHVASRLALDLEQDVRHGRQAPGGLPDLRRVQGRQQHLGSSDRIELLLDDPDHLAEQQVPERKEAVDAACQPTDVVPSDEQAVRGRFGVLWGLPEAVKDERTGPHGRPG